MALVSCKECGEKVSTKAKNCPNCGAKAPKKTSLFTWLVVALIVFGVYVSTQAPSPETIAEHSNTTNKNNTPATQKENNVENKVPKDPEWFISESKDEMTGEFSAYAYSPLGVPTTQMEFPYGDVSGRMVVACNKDSEWAYLSFSSAPNLTKTDTKDGYNLINTRIKWNDEIKEVTLSQDWGSRFFHPRNYDDLISQIESSSTALLELQWHGQSKVYFKYSMNGSSKAIANIRKLCKSSD